MGSDRLSVRDLDVAGKRVLVRADLNVPLDNGRVADDTRIRAALPTLQLLLERGARVILASHLGRPKGRPDPGLSLAPVAARLSELLGQPVPLLPGCVGPEVAARVEELRPGQVVLLENLRFDPGEEKNDPTFARHLAKLADLYVNDAFGAAHRAHASTVGVAAHLPAAAGLLLERELDVLGNALERPERPFVVVLGGAKVKDKLGVVKNLLGRVDALLIGGGMAFTFLKAAGGDIGDSLWDPERLEEARAVLERAAREGRELLLPDDVVIARELDTAAETRVAPAREIPAGWRGLDIGPATAASFAGRIEGARTVIWNGPMGVFELPPFAAGTRRVAEAVAACRGTTILGGGDTVAAVQQAGLADRVGYISTGGGASLEFLEGRELPGVAALSPREVLR